MIYIFKQLRYVLYIINQKFILSISDLFIVLLTDLVIINAIRHAYEVVLRTSILNIEHKIHASWSKFTMFP